MTIKMTNAVVSDARIQLAGWAHSRLPGLIDQSVREITARIPDYYGDRDDQAVRIDELARGVDRVLRHLVKAIADPELTFDASHAAELGRLRARQGVPLPEVLQVCRICTTTLWNGLVEHVGQLQQLRRGAGTEALIGTASMIWQFVDEHATAMTESFRAATAEILLAEQRRRSAIVEGLLTGRPGPESGPWEAAALLGFPAGNQLAVVAAESSGVADESLARLERRLAEAGIVSAWRLTPAQHLGIVSFSPDEYETVLHILRSSAQTRTGVSPTFQSLSQTPRAHQLAQAALAGQPTGEPGVRVFDHSPLAALVVSDSAEGRRLVERVLGPVLHQASVDRDVLIKTLETYLEHGGSAEHAAEILFCHPNTVRNRLRRVQELTGRSLTEPRDVAELTTAVYALRFDRATALWSDNRKPSRGNGPRIAKPRGI